MAFQITANWTVQKLVYQQQRKYQRYALRWIGDADFFTCCTIRIQIRQKNHRSFLVYYAISKWVPVLWMWSYLITLRWSHNGRDGVSNRQPYDCLLNRLFRHRSKKISKLRVTGLCVGNSPVTGEFPAQMASNAENVSISWSHHDAQPLCC